MLTRVFRGSYTPTHNVYSLDHMIFWKRQSSERVKGEFLASECVIVACACALVKYAVLSIDEWRIHWAHFHCIFLYKAFVISLSISRMNLDIC